MTVTHVQDGVEKKLDFTPTEFKIFASLATSAGDIVSRQALHENIWGNSLHINDRAIDQHISTIRKKIQDMAEVFIKTVHGKGYLLIHQK